MSCSVSMLTGHVWILVVVNDDHFVLRDRMCEPAEIGAGWLVVVSGEVSFAYNQVLHVVCSFGAACSSRKQVDTNSESDKMSSLP